MSDKLTGKQKAFADAYISLLNATEAARIAKYKGDDNSLAVMGFENLRKPKIRTYINDRLQETVPPPNEILSRLTEQATINIGIFFKVRPDGAIRLRESMIRKYGHCIKSLKETVNGIQITLYDGQNALIKLGQYYALFTEKFEIRDWRTEAIELIRSGKVTYEETHKELGENLANELFASAGLAISKE